MAILILSASVVFLTAAAFGIATRQKAAAHREYYLEDVALNELALRSSRSRGKPQVAPTRARRAVHAKRKANKACLPRPQIYTRA
jgi:hypothetical protein